MQPDIIFFFNMNCNWLNLFYYLQGSVVANQTATKKDNGLYKVDMIFDTFQKGEHILVVARHGNKSYIIYTNAQLARTDDLVHKMSEISTHENHWSGVKYYWGIHRDSM